MADVLKIVFLIVGTLIVIVSYWLAATALFPQAVSQARTHYERHPVRITLLGTVVGVPLFLLGVALVAAGHALAFRGARSHGARRIRRRRVVGPLPAPA